MAPNPPVPATGAEPAPAVAPDATQVAQQMDAIRSRIEARRAQLRREAQSPGTPARNP